jgi:hypothetical protein
MIVELKECHHVYGMRGWPSDKFFCDRCNITRGLFAIECREWKVSCNTCRYARWCGQSKDNANILSNRHKHYCTVDYVTNDDNRNRLKAVYPPRTGKYVQNQTDLKMSNGEVPLMTVPDIPPF